MTRRAALPTLRRMNWRDRVYLAMLDPRTALVFGTFRISHLSGLSAQAFELVRMLYADRVTVMQGSGRKVQRGCGSYVEGDTLVVQGVSLPEIAEELAQAKERGMDIGLLMVGGRFEEHPLVYLVDVPHQQGFRLFDADGFGQAYRQARQASSRRIPRLRGQFYGRPEDGEEGDGTPATISWVKDYRKKGVKGPPASVAVVR